jgi:hypothetical protein
MINVKYGFVFLIFIFVFSPAFAEKYQQELTTESGTMKIGMYTIPENPLPGQDAEIRVDFINAGTNQLLEHIDFEGSVINSKNTITKIPPIHSVNGSTTIPIVFMDKDEYKINVDVSGILFYPIPTQTVTFTKSIEDVPESSDSGGGCLIATAAFGSELATQVQQLRETRDNKLMITEVGNAFMDFFNKYYYSFSPIIADYERENPLFREAVRMFITPMISTLSIMTLAEDGSEVEVLGLGISIIALNLGIYVATPTVSIFTVSKHLRSRK